MQLLITIPFLLVSPPKISIRYLPAVPDIGNDAMSRGNGYGLGVSVLKDPAESGNLGSRGQFGWGGAATTSVIIDPQEEMVLIFLTQYMPGYEGIGNRFRILVYQSIID